MRIPNTREVFDALRVERDERDRVVDKRDKRHAELEALMPEWDEESGEIEPLERIYLRAQKDLADSEV